MRATAWLLLGLPLGCLSGCFTDPTDTSASGAAETTSGSGADASTTAPTPSSSSSTDPTLDPGSASGEGTTSSTGGSSESTAADSTSTGSDDGSTSTGAGSTSTSAAAECGDDVLGAGEACDGEALGGVDCNAFGFASGTLGCADDCAFAFEGCVAPEGMVFIPEGEFEMGSTDALEEQPVRTVTLSGYFIGITEVTAGDYADCVNAMFCPVPMSTANPSFDDECNYGREDRLDHPINCTGFNQAAAYCNWLDQRLPTEAEWERAARSTDARRYPWGNTPEPSCIHAVMNDGGIGCGEESTFAVMSKPPGVSEDGLHDMVGNVWEWVSDYYGPYNPAETLNPTGPALPADRILRGGGWFQAAPADFTVTHRHEVQPNLSDAFIGFRCVAELQVP